MKTWKMVLPPNRPGEANISFIEDTIRSLPNRENVCILGSTPEYRSFLRKWFASVTVIDKSLDFKAVSDELSGVSENETFFHADWLTNLSDFASTFDLVVSHSTHGNIAFGDRAKFFSLIAGSLRDHGVFVDTIFQPTRDLFGIDDICRIFERKPNNIRTANDFNCIGIFQSARIIQDGFIDSSRIFDWLEAEIEDQDIRRIIRSTEDICPRGMIWHYNVTDGPEAFGYNEVFSVQQERRQSDGSPFANVMTQVACKLRTRHA